MYWPHFLNTKAYEHSFLSGSNFLQSLWGKVSTIKWIYYFIFCISLVLCIFQALGLSKSLDTNSNNLKNILHCNLCEIQGNASFFMKMNKTWTSEVTIIFEIQKSLSKSLGKKASQINYRYIFERHGERDTDK